MLGLSLLPFTLPENRWGDVPHTSSLSLLLPYLLHPLTWIPLLTIAPDTAVGLGNLLLLGCFVGVAEGALLSATLCLLVFTLRHSCVQGLTLALPLLVWGGRTLGKSKSGPLPYPTSSRALRWEVWLLGLLFYYEGWLSTFPLDFSFSSSPFSSSFPALVDATTLTPELTPHWYLLSSAFLPTLPYFTALAWALPLALSAPITLRLGWWGGAPEVAAIVCLGMGALLDPSGPPHTPSPPYHRLPLLLALGAGALGGRGVGAMSPRKLLLWTTLLHAALLAAPAMKFLWLRAGGVGNINFLLWQQLLFTLSGASLLAEFARACAAVMDGKEGVGLEGEEEGGKDGGGGGAGVGDKVTKVD